MTRFTLRPQSRCELAASVVTPPDNRCINCFMSAPLLASVMLFGMSFEVRADDTHLGIIEYEISRVPCRGEAVEGWRTADLTRIAKSNAANF
jgi:hypothetical protein